MPRMHTVAEGVNTILRLVKPSPVQKAELIVFEITSDRSSSKKWKYLRNYLERLSQAEIQAFIDTNPHHFAKQIAETEFLEPEPPPEPVWDSGKVSPALTVMRRLL